MSLKANGHDWQWHLLNSAPLRWTIAITLIFYYLPWCCPRCTFPCPQSLPFFIPHLTSQHHKHIHITEQRGRLGGTHLTHSLINGRFKPLHQTPSPTLSMSSSQYNGLHAHFKYCPITIPCQIHVHLSPNNFLFSKSSWTSCQCYTI